MQEPLGCANGARQKNSQPIRCPWEALRLFRLTGWASIIQHWARTANGTSARRHEAPGWVWGCCGERGPRQGSSWWPVCGLQGWRALHSTFGHSIHECMDTELLSGPILSDSEACPFRCIIHCTAGDFALMDVQDYLPPSLIRFISGSTSSPRDICLSFFDCNNQWSSLMNHDRNCTWWSTCYPSLTYVCACVCAHTLVCAPVCLCITH